MTIHTIVVGIAILLAGCAGLGPAVPVTVTDVKSVVGTWRGLVYQNGVEFDDVMLTIRDDGSYEVVSHRNVGTTVGRGKLVARDGRLIIDGERGRGVATLTSAGPDTARILNIEATLSDNSIVTAKLSPTKP